MHDTACCFGYPSDSSLADSEQQRFGTRRAAPASPQPPPQAPLWSGRARCCSRRAGRAGRVGPSPPSPPWPPSAAGVDAARPGSRGPGRAGTLHSLSAMARAVGRPLSSSSGRRWALPTSHWSWADGTIGQLI
jgi:hypothetical protein